MAKISVKREADEIRQQLFRFGVLPAADVETNAKSHLLLRDVGTGIDMKSGMPPGALLAIRSEKIARCSNREDGGGHELLGNRHLQILIDGVPCAAAEF